MLRDELIETVEGFEDSPAKIVLSNGDIKVLYIKKILQESVKGIGYASNKPIILPIADIRIVDYENLDISNANKAKSFNSNKEPYQLSNIEQKVKQYIFDFAQEQLLTIDTVYDYFVKKYGKEKCNQYLNVINSINYAKKIHEFHKFNDRVTKAIKNLKINCNIEDVSNGIIGAIYYELKSYQDAEKSFYNSSYYRGSFYASFKLGKPNNYYTAGLLAIKNREYDSFVVRNICTQALAKDDKTAFVDIFNICEDYRDDILLAWAVEKHLVAEIPDKENIKSKNNIVFLTKKFKNENDLSLINDNDEKNVGQDSKIERLDGRIIGYFEDRRIGRIRSNQDYEVYDFNLSQVSDEDLQLLVQKNPDKKHNVNFVLGINSNGEIVADDIKRIVNLCEKPSEKSNSGSIEYYKGYISSFNFWNSFGYVVDSNGKEYGFRIDAVKSIGLKNDLMVGQNFDNIQVKFKTKLITINSKSNPIKEVADIIVLAREDIEAIDSNSNAHDTDTSNYSHVQYVPLRRINISEVNEKRKDSLNFPKSSMYHNQNRSITPNSSMLLPQYFYDVYKSKKERNSINVLLDNEATDIQKEKLLNKFVDYLITSQGKEKAYKFLNDVETNKLSKIGINLEKSSFLKLSIRLYDWLKDYNKLVDCYNAIIPMTVDVSRKLHYIQAKAISLLSADSSDNNKSAAVDAYELWLKTRTANALVLGLKNPTNDATGKYVRKQLASLYFSLKETSKAENLIKELKRDNPNDLSIDEISMNAINTAINADVVDIQNNTTDNPWNFPLFLVRIINKFRLTEIVSQRDLLENQYIKDYKAASIYIDKIKEISTLKAKEKADHCFAGLKMLGQLWNENKIPDYEEEKCKKIIEKIAPEGTIALADSVASDESIDVDVMRFYYVKGLELWRRNDRPTQQETNACVRYISSYFVDRDGIKLGMEGNKNLSLKDIPGYLEKNLNLDENLESFINGCLNLIYHTNSNLISVSNLAEQLYYSHYKVDVVNKFNIESNLDSFKKLLNKLLSIYKRNYTDWDSSFKNLPSFQINSNCIDNILEVMQRLRRENVGKLFKLDLERLDDIIFCIENLKTYNKSYDASFEDRDRRLQEVFYRCENLIAHIDREPTEYSLNYYLPLINKIKESVLSSREEIYKNAAPVISLKELETSVDMNLGIITLNIEVSNDDHKQQAIDIVLKSGTDDIEVINDDNLQRKAINGGSKESAIIELRIGEQYKNEKAFTLKLNYSYKYSSVEGGSKSIGTSYSTTIQTSKNFLEIDNPFSAISHAGAVKDINMIYGREELIESIIEKIDNFKQPKSVLLWGQKRTGKSTVLSYLENKLRDKFYDQAFIVNCGEVPELSSHSLRAFKSMLLSKIETQFQDAMDDEGNYRYQDIINALGDMGYEMMGYVPEECANSRFDFFFNSYRRLKINKPSIVLLIDEFSIIYNWIKNDNEGFDISFIKWWRGFLDNNGIVAVMIGQDYMMNFVHLDPNGFGAIDQVKVTYLDPEGFKNLLEQPVLIAGSEESRFREDAIDSIWKLTAGSAFFTVIICSNIIDYLNKKKLNYVTNAVIEDVVAELINGQNPIELTDFDSLYNDEGYIDDPSRKDDCLNILKAIAFNASKTTQTCTQEDIYDYCIQHFAMNKERISDLLENLKNRGVVLYNNQTYKIIVGLFYKWLVAKG